VVPGASSGCNIENMDSCPIFRWRESKTRRRESICSLTIW